MYVDASAVATAAASGDPLMSLQSVINADPWARSSSLTGVAPPRLVLLVANELDSALVQIALDVGHGFQTSEPSVEDANGMPTIAPGAAVGALTFQWIDAPPTGFASIGSWSFDSNTFLGIATWGPKFCLTLRHANTTEELTIAAWMGVGSNDGSCGLWWSKAGASPDVAMAYADIDASTAVSIDAYSVQFASTATVSSATALVTARMVSSVNTAEGVLIVTVKPAPSGH